MRPNLDPEPRRAVPRPVQPPPSAGAAAPHAHVPAWVTAAFAVAVLLTYFALLGRYPMAEPDEGRYAEIAREMIELRDWVTPHLNYVKYFEKPPLVYWMTAINFELFGMSDLVVRLWPAVFGLTGIGMAYCLGRSMYGPWVGNVAAALLAASPFYFGLSQVVILDMPLSALMAIGLGAFWFAYRNTWRRPFVLLLYAATALGVLTKGPVAALLTGAIIFGFLIWRGEFRALGWLVSPLGIALFALMVLPWFVLVSRRNPEFLRFFLINQHVDRFVRPNEHQQGAWFFFPIVWGGMLPWSMFMLCAPGIARQFLGRVMRRQVAASTAFCLLWAGVVFVFFSLSGSKLATYVLPIFCPLAILAARFFREVVDRRQVEVFTRGCIALLVLAVLIVAGAKITGIVVDHWRVHILVPRMYAGGVLIAAAGGAALVLARRRALPHSLAVLILGMLALQLIAMSGRAVVAQYRPLGVTIREQAQPTDLVAQYNHYIQGITFYAQRRTIAVRGHGELDFGSRQGDQRAYFWESDEALLDAWRSDHRLFLVINRLELEPLRARLQPPPRQIAAYGKKVLVVNFD